MLNKSLSAVISILYPFQFCRTQIDVFGHFSVGVNKNFWILFALEVPFSICWYCYGIIQLPRHRPFNQLKLKEIMWCLFCTCLVKNKHKMNCVIFRRNTFFAINECESIHISHIHSLFIFCWKGSSIKGASMAVNCNLFQAMFFMTEWLG